MSQFRYILKDEAGIKVEGTIFGVSRSAALDQIKELKQKDQFIISVAQVKEKASWTLGGPHLSMQDKMIFINSLSTMFKVGITLIEAMDIVVSQTKNIISRKMFEDILNMIRSGQTLSKSLAKYSKVFSEITINMVATGEENGNLDEVLEYLSKQLEKDYEVRKKVISAFIYPIIILSITVTMALGIVVFVMPKILRIFATFKVDLPLPTKILIWLTDLLTKQTLLVLFVTAVVVGLSTFLLRLEQLKPFWHRVYLHFPVLGKIIISSNLARFARTFNSLLRSGTPITKCMEVLQKVFTNVIYKNALTHIGAVVEKGGKLGDAMEQYPKLFPVLVTKMIYIGEKTGSLAVTTEHVADMYERDVDNQTRNLSTLMEPLLLVFMAGLVGGIALSIIMPIYSLPNMISR